MRILPFAPRLLTGTVRSTCKLNLLRNSKITNKVVKFLTPCFAELKSTSYIPTLINFSTMASSNESTEFVGRPDHYLGVTVDSTLENCGNMDEFIAKLNKSMHSWRELGKRTIWFKVALEHSSWVPVLTQQGFDFHHAKSGYVMMYKWLLELEQCRVPAFAHTMLGVGAVVVNERQEILVVQEKYLKRAHWKLPGGYVEAGENIVDAAIREVLEETNIRTEFVSVLNMRQAHGGSFDCSDLYVVVNLKALSDSITKCDNEIAASRWMDVEEYLNHSDIHELNKFFVQCYLNNRRDEIRIDWRHGLHQLLKKPYTVYFAKKA